MLRLAPIKDLVNGWIDRAVPCLIVFMNPNYNFDKETHKCFEQVLLYKLGCVLAHGNGPGLFYCE